MPHARRRDIRRWSERRARRRRRVRLVGTAGALVVALALILTAAPGAHAPSGEATIAALASGELVDRIRDVASRSAERTPVPEPAPTPTAPEQTSSAAAAAPEVTPEASPEPAPQPAPEPPPQDPATTAAQAAPVGVAAAGAMPDEIVALTNAQRAAAGLPGLAVSPCAAEQASARAALLVAENRFEHDPLRPVLEACRAGTVGENLSLGYASAQAAVDGWMASPGHRENILRTSYTQIGVACERGARGWLCAQVFLG